MAVTPNHAFLKLENAQLPHQFNSQTMTNLDTAVTMSVLGVYQSTPPSSPSPGDSYHVYNSSNSAGLWLGFRDVIATWNGGSWSPMRLKTGMRVLDQSRRTYHYFVEGSVGVGGTWVAEDDTMPITINLFTLADDYYLLGSEYSTGVYPLWYREGPHPKIISCTATMQAAPDPGGTLINPWCNVSITGWGRHSSGELRFGSGNSFTTGVGQVALVQTLPVSAGSQTNFPVTLAEANPGWVTLLTNQVFQGGGTYRDITGLQVMLRVVASF